MELSARRKIYNRIGALALLEGLLMFILPSLAKVAVCIIYPGESHKLLLDILYDLSYIIALILPVLIYCLASGHTTANLLTPKGEERPRGRCDAAIVVVALALVNVMAYVNFYIIAPFADAGILVNVYQENEINGVLDIVLLIISSVIIPPLTEELFFRGLILGRLRPLGAVKAIVLSSLMFALFHGNVAQFIYTFFAGLAFGYCALLTGRLWLPILIHMLNNALSVGVSLLAKYTSEIISSYISFGFDLFLFFAGLLLMIYIMYKRTSTENMYRLPDIAVETISDVGYGSRTKAAIAPVMIFYVIFVLIETALTNLAIFYK